MELDTVNKLYLELSQIATAKTARELELEDLLTSARAIAQRGGEVCNHSPRGHWTRINQATESSLCITLAMPPAAASRPRRALELLTPSLDSLAGTDRVID